MPTSVEVNALVVEPIMKSVSASTAASVSRSVTPKPRARTTSPSLTTTIDIPGM